MKKLFLIILSICSMQWMICSCEKSYSDDNMDMDDSTNELTNQEIAEQNMYEFVRYEIYSGEEWPPENKYVDEFNYFDYENIIDLCDDLDSKMMDETYFINTPEYEDELIYLKLERVTELYAAELTIRFKNRTDLEEAFITFLLME